MGHGAVRDDPAIERFNRMREEAYLGYRWTRRTVRTAILGAIIFPGVIFWASYQSDLRWNWVGKQKGQSLNRVQPKPEPEPES